MAVRTKGRRKIICNGKKYIWHIKPGYDDPYHWLHIMAEDKSFYMICPLATDAKEYRCQADGSITEMLPAHMQDPYLRIGEKAFPLPKIVTPGIVSDLIAFAKN